MDIIQYTQYNLDGHWRASEEPRCLRSIQSRIYFGIKLGFVRKNHSSKVPNARSCCTLQITSVEISESGSPSALSRRRFASHALKEAFPYSNLNTWKEATKQSQVRSTLTDHPQISVIPSYRVSLHVTSLNSIFSGEKQTSGPVSTS